MKYVILFALLALNPITALAVTPNDTYFDDQWYLEKIHAPAAWDIETGNTDVIVAVIDSGIDIDHEDLSSNVWVNADEIPDNGIDDDDNGYVDDVYGWDFVDGDAIPVPSISTSAIEGAVTHGSLVAGMIGAVTDNSKGVAGTAWNVSLMALRTLDEEGSGNSHDVADALDYAIAMGADVVNLSFVGDASDSILESAILRAYDAGIVIVASVGNENINMNVDKQFPVCYTTESEDFVIGVSATTSLDRKAPFSNYGNVCADIAAPGVDILGVSYHDPADGYDDKYVEGWSGTSMSAPLVSGASALLLSAYPTLSPESVRIVLELSVDPVYGPLSAQMGSGRLNIERALSIAGSFVEEEEVVETVIDGVVTTGENFKAPSFSSVYRLAGDGSRNVFMNAITYFTWEDSFAQIETVADTALSDYALGGIVLPKAGVVLVKIQSDPRVYALENTSDPYTPALREIPSEEMAIALYGEAWADYVIDIEPTYFARFSTGREMTEDATIDMSIMKTRAELAALAN